MYLQKTINVFIFSYINFGFFFHSERELRLPARQPEKISVLSTDDDLAMFGAQLDEELASRRQQTATARNAVEQIDISFITITLTQLGYTKKVTLHNIIITVIKYDVDIEDEHRIAAGRII